MRTIRELGEAILFGSMKYQIFSFFFVRKSENVVWDHKKWTKVCDQKVRVEKSYNSDGLTTMLIFEFH